MVADAQHDDVVVEVDRPKMKLLPDFADLPVGETETLLQVGLAVVLSNCVLVALAVVFYSYSLQISILEYTVLDKVIPVVPTNPLERIVEVLPNTHDSVLL